MVVTINIQLTINGKFYATGAQDIHVICQVKYASVNSSQTCANTLFQLI